ncbi:uncharacterized protein K02A2.6 isoform X2 [Aedes albopictus]|uniref:Integrase catalytic domain-containing protein n=1 Tax=Aedes albopictus TaxID=7160 RepID=A0ABM2A1C9_AEDAL
MKQFARRMVYWFGINGDIDKYVTECDACSSMTISHKPNNESKRIPTTRPFSRVHIDFFFFEHRTYLLIVDSFSKWIEIEYMKQGTDTAKVLKKLVAYFARFGLPDVLVSDNGPPFNSYNFVNLLEKQGIRVFKSPPYNPSSNGQAERLVRTVKEVLKRYLMDPDVMELDLDDRINLFLFNFRNCNLTKDGYFPSETIFSYKPKTVLDLVNPKKYYKKLLDIPQSHDDLVIERNSREIPLQSKDAFDNLMAGDDVWYKNNNRHLHVRWVKATFIKWYSPNILQICIGSVNLTAHRTQIRICKGDNSGQRPNMLITRFDGDENTRSEEPRRSEGSMAPNDEPIIDDTTAEAPSGARKRKRRRSDSGVEHPVEPRRSKRSKKTTRSEDFWYN